MINKANKALQVCLLIVLRISTSGSTKNEETQLKQHHGNTYGLFTGNDFSFKTVLDEPEKEIKFTFILVRHAMVLPHDEPYPLDLPDCRNKYGKAWKTQETTTRGNQLMNMIGRSLKTRYKTYLDTIWTWEEITLTTIKEKFAVENAEYLAQGLFRNTVHESRSKEQSKDKSTSDRRVTKEGGEDYDKYNFVHKCTWLDRILTELNTELFIPDNSVTLKYCTHDFYKALRQFVVMSTTKREDFWWIESPEHVVRLWRTLWFEVQEGQGLPLWAEQYWSNMLACVFEYHKLLMNWHPDVVPMMIGRMFTQITNEKEEGKEKLHIHITDDITIIYLLWNLPINTDNRAWNTLWPDYGDALILDFYKDDSVKVSLFSGMMETNSELYTSDYETLKNHFIKRGLNLIKKEFVEICTFNPKIE